MLVRHLSYFATLARERHFARAAELCNITQPTLSAALRKLEEDLGAPLVVRNQRFIGLTSEGEKVLAWSRQILTDYTSLRDDLSGMKRGLTGTLHLGVIPAAMPAVAFVTARFCERHPAAKVEIQSMTSRAIQNALDRFEIDGGMTYLDNEPLANVRRVALYREHFVFAVRREHPLAGRQEMSWSEASKQRLCLLSEDMQNRRIIDTLAHSVGVVIQPEIVSNSYLAVCAHLRQGRWASIVPHTFFTTFGGASGLVGVPLVAPIHDQPVGLVLADRDPPSAMASALLAAVGGADLEAEIAASLGGT
jgi:DNA-binding transcriptional LysR family regulator